MKLKQLYLSICVFVLIFSSSVGMAVPEQAKAYGLGEPAQVTDLPPGRLRTHIENLPIAARERALQWLQAMSFPEEDVDFLQVDTNGGVFYADTLLPKPVEEQTETEDSVSPEPETISATDTFLLHSKPGSSNVLFLDFDGHMILSSSAWTNIDLDAVAYDNSSTDDDSAFTASELSDIAEIWHRIAEDFSPFDIDVTTEEPSIFTSTTGHLLFTKDTDANGNAMPSAGGGGVAYVNVWGSGSYVSSYSPALVYYDNLGPNFPPFMAEAAAHEFGHNQGLSHDGVSGGTSYYSGHGGGLVNWGPIMGTGYNDNVSQWSKGEYLDANNTQDDLAILDTNLNYRTDDHNDSLVGATALLVEGTGDIPSTNQETDPDNNAPENKGIIEQRSDIDMFYFDAAAGAVSLSVLPAWDAFERPSNDRGANLDIKITLYDASGTVIASSEPDTDTRADINTTVVAGRYYLSVTGVGNSVSPYSDYASLGYYYIFGNVVSQNLDPTAPTPNPMTWAVSPFAQGKYAIAMTATTATDDSGFIEYNFLCTSGGQGCVDSGWQISNGYTANGLAPGSLYSFQVKARDGSHNETGVSTTASATTDTETIPAVPSNFTATTISTTQISLNWQDNADNEVGLVIERSLDGVSGWSQITSLNADSTSYTDDSLDHSTTYYYRLKAFNSVGDSSYISADATTDSPPAFIDYVATGETIFSGVISGNYLATQSDDGNVQSITERDSGGKPANRYDYMEHRWTFNINGGVVVSLFTNAWTNGSEDAFDFEYSTDGSSYQPAFTVSSLANDNVQGAVLNAGINGTVYVRVRDTDNTPGHRNHQTIFVDHLYIRSENAVGGVAPVAPGNLTAVAETSSQITIGWQDNSDNESGFAIERSPDSSSWSPIGTAALNAISYTDTGLNSAAIYYYKVKAFNPTGDSGYTNTAFATTDAATAIALSANGFKVKGKQSVDLSWSGATSVDVDIWRNGSQIVTTTNDGFYNDYIGINGGATYVYQVCHTGSSDCSDEVTVIF